jgi:hypothetical protein
MMLEAFDPTYNKPVQTFVASLDLSEAARARLDGATSVRRYVERLAVEGCAVDALTVIAHGLPTQYLAAWCCECVRNSLDSAGTQLEAERAAIALAEQCLRHPTDDNRELCLEFAERAKHRSAGAWLTTAAAWVVGSLAPRGSPHVPAPDTAIAAAVLAALQFAAARYPGAARQERLKAYAERALVVFGTA